MAVIKKNTTPLSILPAIKLWRRFCILIIIIILIPITLSLFATHKPKVTSPQTSTPATSNITSVKGDSYTLSYPKDWSEYESAGVKGGSVYYLSPPHADAVVKPHVILQVLTATQETMQRMTLSYALLKYQKEAVTISGTPAQKYTAVLPSEHGPFHSIAYVFIANGKLYLLELGYTQTAIDTQLEQTFQHIVNAFSLN